jgi:hypothetical protein
VLVSCIGAGLFHKIKGDAMVQCTPIGERKRDHNIMAVKQIRRKGARTAGISASLMVLAIMDLHIISSQSV